MNRVPTRYQLESKQPAGSMRFLAGLHVTLEEGKRTSVVTIIRTGSFYHPDHGRFEVTHELLDGMVSNFEAKTYGQDIFIDVAHEPQKGAAGEIKRLFVEGNRLRAMVEWTPYGMKAIQERGFRYLSADYWDDWQDNEQGNKHGPLLAGAGLVTRPHIKRLDPVVLAESSTDGIPTFLHPELSNTLQSEAQIIMKKFIEQLQAALKAKKLSEKAIAAIVKTFEQSAKSLGEDEPKLKTLMESFVASADEIKKQLDEKASGGEINITLSQPAAGSSQQSKDPAEPKALTEADVERILNDRQTAAASQAKSLKEKLDTNVRLFGEQIDGVEGFSDELKKKLKEGASDLITPTMTEDQVKKFAEHEIATGKQLNESAAQQKLQAMGYGASGTVRITVDESNTVKQLQEHADKRLGLANVSDAKRFKATGGKLQDENKVLAEQVLAEFDATHAMALERESKRLAAGDGSTSDVVLPATFERTVIREAIYALRGTQLVDVGTASFGAVIEIPYSYRDLSAAGRNAVRVYESQPIQRAGVIQTTCEARPIPQKLAFLVSDELRYLMQAGKINWDAVSENRSNASRIIAEDTDMLIHNELLNASDEFGAVAVANEDLEPGFDGTNTIFPLAQFPVVRPRMEYDLKGNQVGSTVNPIVVNYDGQARAEYDGTGTQAAGFYYVLDYNHGELSIVTEAGAVVAPADTTVCNISYSYAANVAKFDTDLGSDAVKVKWDFFLYRFGLRKNIVQDDRYYNCDFAAMSGNVMTQVEQAETFGANFAKPGTELAMNGDLGRIKDVPGFRTSAPGISLGDQRVVMGERGSTRFRMVKPWSMGDLENERNADGLFTGEKQSYGDQFIVVKTPEPLANAYTSMVLYSASGRVAR